jgi:hypothetical protein
MAWTWYDFSGNFVPWELCILPRIKSCLSGGDGHWRGREAAGHCKVELKEKEKRRQRKTGGRRLLGKCVCPRRRKESTPGGRGEGVTIKLGGQWTHPNLIREAANRVRCRLLGVREFFLSLFYLYFFFCIFSKPGFPPSSSDIEFRARDAL